MIRQGSLLVKGESNEKGIDSAVVGESAAHAWRDVKLEFFNNLHRYIFY